MGKTRISGNALRQKDSFVNGEFLKEFFRALMGVEHSELQIEDGFTRDREIEVARFDDACMDRSYGHLKDTFTQSWPVDVAFSFKRRQDRLEGKILAQGINIGPIVVQGDPAGIRVSNGLESKPILDFTLLPVRRRQFSGERGKLKTVGPYWRPHNQVLRAALLFKDIVVEENALCTTPVFGEHRNQPSPEFASQVFCDRPNVRVTQKEIDFIFK